MALTSIYDLAELAVTKFGLKGIDWAALGAQGRGSVWDRDYMTEYMLPAQVQMIAAVGAITFDVGGDRVALQQSFSLNADLLQSIASSVMPLFNAPDPLLVTSGVQLSRESIRYLVSHAYQAANYSLLLHLDETIHHSGMSDAEISSHANVATGTMNALALLDKLGFYTALGLKDAPAQSGLGIAPALLVALVVVAIAALAICAWVLVSLVDLTKKNAIVAKTCANAQASGDAATTQQCINTLTDPNKNAGTAVPVLIKQTLMQLVPYAIGGVAIYALYLAAPYLIKNLLSPKPSAA